MGALFFAVADDKSIGIRNKVICQAKSMSSIFSFCDLLTLKNGVVVLKHFENEEQIGEELLLENAGGRYLNRTRAIQKTALDMLGAKEYDVIYFRDQIWTAPMSSIMEHAKKKNIITYMEIPTYPYYKEQMAVAANKAKAALVLALSFFSDKMYFRLVDHIPVVVSNSKIKMTEKMIPMTNGADTGFFDYQSHRAISGINIVGSGYLSTYHGFEKVIRSMDRYYKNGGTQSVFFYIAGEGPQKKMLKEMAKETGLTDRVFFLGELGREKLKELYKKASVSVGTLSLQKRGADTDTSLKTVESFVQGIPVIAAGKLPDPIVDDRMCFHINPKADSFDMEGLCKFLNEYDIGTDEIECLRKRFDWKKIMNDVFQVKGGKQH